MKRDPFHTRLREKIFKEVRLRRWRKWVVSYQDEDFSDKELLESLNVKTKDEAILLLRNQIRQYLIDWDFKTDSISSDKHANEATLSILGTQINISEVSSNWHKDWLSGYRWPVDWHWNIKTVRYDGSDVKLPWELSRCQFLTQWAREYAVSDNPKIAASFVKLLDSWMIENPSGKGVNWTCAMEVAIRAANWLLVIPYFIKSSFVSDTFIWSFYKSIFAHGKYLESNLEGPGWYAANHYIADLAGLYFIGSMCPAFSISKKWVDLAQRELEKEMQRQVLCDGTCFEQSTAYHRLTFEIFYYPYWLATKTGTRFSREYVSRLKKMLEVVDIISKPNGSVPQIGDNDNGQFFKLEQTSVMDHRYLMDIGVSVLDMPNLKHEKRNISESVIMLGGKTAMTNWNNATIIKRPAYSIRSLVDSGWHVMENSNWWLIINTGASRKQSHAAHVHDDRLSVEVSCDGQDVIVDTGTYTYTRDPEERIKFRGARYHNKLRREETIQNLQNSDPIFYNQPPKSATYLDSIEDADKLQWRGMLLLGDMQWRRDITVTQNVCRVSDTVSRVDNINGSLNIHPDVKVNILEPDSDCFKLILPSGDELSLGIFGAKNIQIVKSWFSPEYGIKKKTCQILYDIHEAKSGFSLERFE